MLMSAGLEICPIPPTKRPGNKGAWIDSVFTDEDVGRQPQAAKSVIVMASSLNAHDLSLPNAIEVYGKAITLFILNIGEIVKFV